MENRVKCPTCNKSNLDYSGTIVSTSDNCYYCKNCHKYFKTESENK